MHFEVKQWQCQAKKTICSTSKCTTELKKNGRLSTHRQQMQNSQTSLYMLIMKACQQQEWKCTDNIKPFVPLIVAVAQWCLYRCQAFQCFSYPLCYVLSGSSWPIWISSCRKYWLFIIGFDIFLLCHFGSRKMPTITHEHTNKINIYIHKVTN